MLTPALLAAVYALMSVLTFIAYAMDKSAATRGQRRIPERRLHGMALACGWPGALLAQPLLRHKTSKTAFRRVFWLTVALNLGGLSLLISRLF